MKNKKIILIFIFLFFLSFWTFIRNESYFLQSERTFQSRQETISPVDERTETLRSTSIQTQGQITATRWIIDDVTWLLFNDVLAIRATVEMYQYTEHVREDGYLYYILDRHEKSIDYEDFVKAEEYVNHPFSLRSYTLYNQFATINNFSLDPLFLASLWEIDHIWQDFWLMYSRSDLWEWLFERSTVIPSWVYIGISHTANPDQPVVWDTRILYEYIPFWNYTVWWQQEWQSLMPFSFRGKNIALTGVEELSRESIAIPTRRFAWSVRFVSRILMIISLVFLVPSPSRRFFPLSHHISRLSFFVPKKIRWSLWFISSLCLAIMTVLRFWVLWRQSLLLLILFVLLVASPWAKLKLRKRK